VLVQVPGYGPIRNCPEKHGAERREATLVQGPGGRYEIDWDSFERAIDRRTKVFLLCNPHNPVGRVFTRDELARMAETCLQRDMLIISDEIHSDLVYDGHPHTPIAALSPEVEARTITLMAPSKTFNLPGLKCSIAIIPNKELRERFVAAKGELVRAVNILGYTASLAAYRDGDEWLEGLIPYLQANRDYLAEFVRDRLPGVSCAPAEGTYLAWLDCRALSLPGRLVDRPLAGAEATPRPPAGHDPGGGPAAFFLERAKVALSSGPNFGTGGSGFVRLNFACPRPLLEEGLARIQRAIQGL
jgi:cystathionine beta-lyase